MQTIEPSGAASENQASGARMRDDTGRECESHGLRYRVNGTEQASALKSCIPGFGEDLDLAHWREVNDQAVVARAKAGKTMASTTDCSGHTRRARRVHSCLHVSLILTSRDQPRPASNQAVPKPTGVRIWTGLVARRPGLIATK